MKKKVVAFDASMISDKNAGIGYYAQELLSNLGNENVLVYAFSNREIKIKNKYVENIVIEGKIGFLWHLKAFLKMKKLAPDAIISPSNFIYGFLSNRTIQIVHDIAPIKFPDHYGRLSALKFKFLLKLASIRARYLAAISQTTANDLIEFVPRQKNKVVLIGAGLNKHFLEPELEMPSKVLDNFNLISKKYVLSVGTLQPRKNYEKAIIAFSKFKKQHKDYKYVIVGNLGWKYQNIFKIIEEYQLQEDVVITGFLKEDELRIFYQNAAIYLNTSIWEGFGLPLIEAIYFNVPLVVSDISIFHEVVNDYAFFVDPKNPDEIYEGLVKALNNKLQFSADKILSKYEWKKVADAVIKILDKNMKKEVKFQT